MNSILASLSVALIAVVPLWLMPARITAVLAIASSICCIVGLFWRVLGATHTGCFLAVMNLALALWWNGTSLNVFGAVAFGIAQLLVLESAHFASRFAGAEVDRSASRRQVAWWIARAALCFVAAMLVLVVASALTAVMPTYGRPMVAAIGALLAFAATLKVALS